MTDTDPGLELRRLVDKGGIAMLTTVSADGRLEARPIDLQDFDDANRMWYFTECDAPKVEQLAADPRVLVTLSGKDLRLRPRNRHGYPGPVRQQELWDASVKAWMQCEPRRTRRCP